MIATASIVFSDIFHSTQLTIPNICNDCCRFCNCSKWFFPNEFLISTVDFKVRHLSYFRWEKSQRQMLQNLEFSKELEDTLWYIHTNATVYHHYLLQYIFAIISQLRFNESANGYVMIAKYTNNCRVMPATTLRKLLLSARVGCSYATRTMTTTTTNNTTTATSRHSSWWHPALLSQATRRSMLHSTSNRMRGLGSRSEWKKDKWKEKLSTEGINC